MARQLKQHLRAVLAIAALGPAASCPAFEAMLNAAVPNFEIEPNEFKGSATPAASGGPGLANGDTLVGTSTGDFTGYPGDFTADYYLVQTAAAPLGIYRHRLSLSAPINSYSASIRGLNQTESGPGFLDIPLQIAQSEFTSPPRFVQWYGFGKQEQLYYRVSGTPNTTAPYTVTLDTQPVVPIVAAATVTAGLVTVAPSEGNAIDVDFWVYDQSLTPVPTFGADEPNTAARTLTPGTYYIAWTNWNLASNQTNPATETYLESPLTDFPDILCCSSQSTFASNNLDIISSSGTITVEASKPGPFDIAFIQFTVVPPPPPTPIVVGGRTTLLRRGISPTTSTPCGALITAAAAAGANPASSSLAVTVDLTAVGGSVTALRDDGTAGDAVAGDNIWSLQLDCSALPGGTVLLPVTASDAQGRLAQSTATLIVEDFPVSDLGTLPFDDTTRSAEVLIPVSGGAAWLRFNLTQPAIEPDRFLDIHTGGSSLTDTTIALFDESGARRAANDDWDLPRGSSGLSFGRSIPLRQYPQITSAASPIAMAGQQGTLAAGTYYLALAPFGIEFGQTGFSATGETQPGGWIAVHFISSTPDAPLRCPSDITLDGTVDGSDFVQFINAFASGDLAADVSGDGIVDGTDFITFIGAFSAGC